VKTFMTKESLVIGELTAEEKAQLEKWMNEPGKLIEVPDVAEKIKGYSWQTYVDAVKGMPQQQRVPAELWKKAEESERNLFERLQGCATATSTEYPTHHRSCALRNGGRECSC